MLRRLVLMALLSSGPAVGFVGCDDESPEGSTSSSSNAASASTFEHPFCHDCLLQEPEGCYELGFDCGTRTSDFCHGCVETCGKYYCDDGTCVDNKCVYPSTGSTSTGSVGSTGSGG